MFVVYCVKSVIDELGHSDVRIALKSDAAPELQQIREQVRNLRTVPTTPIDVAVQESKTNGAVGRASGKDNVVRFVIMSKARLGSWEARSMRCILFGNGVLGGIRRSSIATW